MLKLLLKLLGLNTLVSELNTLKNEVLVLADENKELKKSLAEVTEKVDEIEIPDMDDYVQGCDLDDNIESYLNNNDYATQNWVEEEIESKVSDAIDDADIDAKVESAIEDLDIEEKVRDLFNDASPAPMSVEDIKNEVREATKVTLERMVKALAEQG